MLRMPAVSGLTLRSPVSGTGIGGRRSPVEIVATMGTYLTRTHAAEVSGLRAGPFGRWADGVTAMREDCAAFARHWQAHNDRVLRPAQLDGPLWVVLGDSTAQGLGALSPDGGYVGQVLAELRGHTGLPWRVLNLSVSGSLTRDVLGAQLPLVPAHADLVTCGIGVNDILYTSPAKLFTDLRADRGRPGPDRAARPAAARGLLGLPRPGQRALRDPDQPDHPPGRRRPGPARRRDLRALLAALGRQVCLRLLPPQSGRLPRLDPRPPRHPAQPGRVLLTNTLPNHPSGGAP